MISEQHLCPWRIAVDEQRQLLSIRCTIILLFLVKINRNALLLPRLPKTLTKIKAHIKLTWIENKNRNSAKQERNTRPKLKKNNKQKADKENIKKKQNIATLEFKCYFWLKSIFVLSECWCEYASVCFVEKRYNNYRLRTNTCSQEIIMSPQSNSTKRSRVLLP